MLYDLLESCFRFNFCKGFDVLCDEVRSKAKQTVFVKFDCVVQHVPSLPLMYDVGSCLHFPV